MTITGIETTREATATITPGTPARSAATVRLGDGHGLGVHHLSAGSRDLFAGFLAELSPEDRYRRFFQAVPRITASLVGPLCEVDQARHIAWLLLDGATPVAEVRAVTSRHDRRRAEIAIAVHHDWRRRGVARQAIRALGVAARDERIDEFSATAQSDNKASVALVSSLGMRLAFEDGELWGRARVPEWTGTEAEAEAEAIRAAQRTAASRVAALRSAA